jgi:hypothetical protein
MKASAWTGIIGVAITTIGAIIIAYLQFRSPASSPHKTFDVEGYVLDMNTGNVIVGASLEIGFEGAPLEVSTDSKGYYHFSLQSAEEYLDVNRRTSAPGYTPLTEYVKIPRGAQENLRLTPVASRTPPAVVTRPVITGVTRLSTLSVNPFAGEWLNEDLNTRGLTKLQIDQGDGQMRVHAWGRCHPTDCDWGIQAGAMIGQGLTITWDQGFVLRKMVVTKRTDDECGVVTDSVYSDRRPRQQTTDVFRRAR